MAVAGPASAVPAPTLSTISPTLGPVTGGQTGTASISYTVGALPTIDVIRTKSSYYPASGLALDLPTSGNYGMTVCGKNFSASSTVTFGGVPALSSTVSLGNCTNGGPATDDMITAYEPAHDYGAIDVQVTNQFGTSLPTPGDVLTYQPTVSSAVSLGGAFSCASATAPPVTSLTNPSTTTICITGTGFGNGSFIMGLVMGTSKTSPAPVALTNIHVLSPTLIQADVPIGPGGTTAITDTIWVVTTGRVITFNLNQTTFLYEGAPTFTSYSTTHLLSAGGTSVTIRGTNLAYATSVLFGATPVTSIVSDTPTALTVIAPAGYGTAALTVTAPGGTLTKGTFYFDPYVSTIVPGPGSGQSTIFGAGFVVGHTTIKVGATTIPSGSVLVLSQNVIYAYLGAGFVSGVTVTITTPYGSTTYIKP